MISFSAAQVASWEFFRDIALGRYALIDTSSSALGISAGFEKVGRSCLFHPAREPVRLDLDAFAYPKNSPIIYQFDEIMRWLRSYGIIQYMKNQYYTKACDTVMHSDKSKPLSVTQAQGAFYIISVGLGISLLTFALENLIHNCCST
ncbi:uncharacterized protein [Palaemon carinicauda]|uniref:uncharacterized protein n=1 Tax=Palaemon carinicauda TaxID=392227 RepID=UPI0035B57570